MRCLLAIHVDVPDYEPAWSLAMSPTSLMPSDVACVALFSDVDLAHVVPNARQPFSVPVLAYGCCCFCCGRVSAYSGGDVPDYRIPPSRRYCPVPHKADDVSFTFQLGTSS